LTEKTEHDYNDGIIPGILYGADAGGVTRFVPRSCHTGGPCRVSCRLYGEHGECKYEDSLTTMMSKKPDTYRFIDNVLKVPSSLNHPLVDKAEKSDLVVRDDAERGKVASQCSSPPPNLESEVDEELKKLAHKE